MAEPSEVNLCFDDTVTKLLYTSDTKLWQIKIDDNGILITTEVV